MSAESSRTRRRGPRAPWYRNSNWFLLIGSIVVASWTYHIFTQGGAASSTPPPARTAAVPAKPVSRASSVYPKPSAPARIVQFAHAAGDHGTARPTDLTVALTSVPKAGDLLVAFGSSGFGCVPSAGWTRLGNETQGSTALAYHVVQVGDGKVLAPFTTPRPNSFTLEMVEIAGDAAIVSGAQAGGIYVPSATLTNMLALAIPQTGGLLLQLDAASGDARNGPPVAMENILPPGQKQVIVDRVPAHGWGSELIIRAVTTEPYEAAQPFKIAETTTYGNHKLPGNIVVGRLIWIGGVTDGSKPPT